MADPASNLLSDALMGKPVDDTASSVSAPVSTPTAMPNVPAEPTPFPSTEISIPEKTLEPVLPESLQATPVPIEPGKPVETVTPMVPKTAPPSIPTLPTATSKKGIPTAALIGLAGLAVVTVGIVTAITLAGESQELRQRAYVPPAATARVTPPPTAEPTIEESFQAFRRQYPTAQQVALTGEVTGTAYFVRDETVGFWQFYIELTGAADPGEQEYFSWVETLDNVYLLSSFTFSQGGKAYSSGVIPSTYTNGTIIVSLETPGSEIFGLLPTKELSRAQF